MVVVRYTEWDGSQRVRLNPERAFAKLAEYLSYTDDLQQALDWLMRHGAEWDDLQIPGVDDFLDELRKELRQQQQSINFDHALDEIRQRLDELLDLERDALEQQGGRDAEGAKEKQEFLDRLPQSLPDALDQLRQYEFEDEDAQRDFENLLEELDNIRDLDNFMRQHGDQFQGPKSLDYSEALEAMQQIMRLKQLEEQLMSGGLASINTDTLGDLLGEQSARSFAQLKEMMLALQQAGYVVSKGTHLQLSPKGVRRLGQLALRDIYQGLLRTRPGAHQTDHRGMTNVRPEQTRPYNYGDPMTLDLVATLKKAVARRPGTPLQIAPDDLEVYTADFSATTSTVLLLDMSWSMSWEGRFAAAKKVALALEALIRTRYPRDYFGLVGFYTRAVELKIKDLPEASWNVGEPFTNLQDGLHLATRLLDKHPNANRHIIVITDGQPTAYFSRGRLYCEWPLSFGGISTRAARETLREVERVTRKEITINTFMLDDSPSLRSFVERMTCINKGRAFYTGPNHLGRYLLVDYLGKKRKRV